MNIFDKICFFTDSKDEIIKEVNEIKTKSKSIRNTILELKKYLKKDDCEHRKYAEKKLEELQKLEKMFKKYQNTKYTTKTNAELRKLFASIDFKKDLELIIKKINTKIENEEEKLKDTWFGNSYRDFVEKNIVFKGEYIQ